MTERLSLTHSRGNPENKAGELAFNRKREELRGALITRIHWNPELWKSKVWRLLIGCTATVSDWPDCHGVENFLLPDKE